jgi:hypothetical protein
MIHFATIDLCLPLIHIKPLKTEFLIYNIYKNSVRTSQETLRLRYKAQPVNAVWGNSRCLL